MFCENCGTNISDKAVVCPHCGTPTSNYYAANGRQTVQAQSSGTAVAGFVLSIFGIWFGILFCIVPVTALILSAAGLKASKLKNSGGGLATAGLVISILTTLLYGIMFIALIAVSSTATYY